MPHSSLDDLAARLTDAAQNVIVGSRYAHYKSPDQTYTVTGIAILESTEEPCVLYRADYDERITFVRPLSSWLESVTVDGKPVPRFVRT